MQSQKKDQPVMKTEQPKPSAEEPKKEVEKKKKKKDDSRKVFDNIHGFIRFERRIWYFIDTPEFQKLRNIKQLGCLSWVFPGATHTRFQHSLGTGHLAQTFISLLIKNNPDRYENMTEQQKLSAIYTVTLAGIMHDVGHGPFSHTFDNDIVNTKILVQGSNEVEGDKWKHEIGSQLIFRHMVAKYGLVEREVISVEEVERVVRLIHGNSDGVREWQFQLISNKETGIDVDKLDYFRRDAFYLGAKGVQIDHQLLMNQAKILVQRTTIQNTQITRYNIGYPSKYALQVNEIFYSRYKLYKTYYFNNVSKGVQFMIMDLLKLVEPIFRFTEICRNIRQGRQWIMKYVALTDNILERVQFLDEQQYEGREDFVRRIRQAKIILLKLKYRKIYKFVREVQTSITLQRLTNNNILLRAVFNPNNISNFIAQHTHLSTSLFHIAVSEAGYGLKEINPLKKVKFFRKEEYTEDDQEYIPLTEEEFKAENISILYTEAFAERFAKLYVTNVTNLDDVRRINEAFVLYFAIQPEEIGQIFNQMTLGRTNFYPPDLDEGNMWNVDNYYHADDPDHQQHLP